MPSSESPGSSSSSSQDATSSEPDCREHVNRQDSDIYDQDAYRRAQVSWQNLARQMRPSEELVSSSSGSPQSTNAEEQAWSDFLRDHPSPRLRENGWPHPRRDIASVIDRRRRVTNPILESGRVANSSGGFSARDPSAQSSYPGDSSSATLPACQRYDIGIGNSPRASFSERKLGVPHPFRIQSAKMQSPVTTNREIILPRWQPDSEVTQCPICSTQFTFFIRKHHCRKCGRVVCAGCSPHRITIPRQFIVNPPDYANRTSPVAASNHTLVDLMGEAGSPARRDTTPSSPRSQGTSSPGLGGGEEVRLCNPCVPDPQPNPQTAMDLAEIIQSAREEVNGSLEELQSFRSLHLDSNRPSLYGQRSSPGEAREYCRQRRHGLTSTPQHESLDTVQPPRLETPNQNLTLSRGFNYAANSDTYQRDRPPRYRANLDPTLSASGYRSRTSSASFHLHGPPPSGSALPGELSPHLQLLNADQLQAHARYPHIYGMGRPTPSAENRPRVRSMLGAEPGFRRFMDQVSPSSSSRPLPQRRSQLQESDMCPLCRDALPPKGADGDETAREAHIMDCIAARDPSAPSSTSARRESMVRSPPAGPVPMLPFTASEKDCVVEDGTAQECLICFVEYDVGDQLARLECLCKFHKKCILQWFQRKQECPVHKLG